MVAINAMEVVVKPNNPPHGPSASTAPTPRAPSELAIRMVPRHSARADQENNQDLTPVPASTEQNGASLGRRTWILCP